MIEPPIWTAEQLEADRLKASAAFSKERLEEPLEDYLEAFDEYQGYVEEVLETTVDLSNLEAPALDVLGDQHLLEAFRYLAAPPISEDDLKVLADARSLAKGTLQNSPELVQRLIAVVRQVLDRRRFAWVVENREPTTASDPGAAGVTSVGSVRPRGLFIRPTPT
ncbi:TPA: XamI family restriction endonuclease [Pseudomonas aeruginosa]|nr:XamI family restriction endonuclease [Pseudomonas aeruginosa]